MTIKNLSEVIDRACVQFNKENNMNVVNVQIGKGLEIDYPIITKYEIEITVK